MRLGLDTRERPPTIYLPPSERLAEKLETAKHIVVAKGRLETPSLEYIHAQNIDIPDLPRSGGTAYNNDGTRFTSLKDSSIAEYVLKLPGALGITADHQLTRKRDLPSNYWSQRIVTLGESRFAIAIPKGEAELDAFLHKMLSRKIISFCCEYPEKAQTIIDRHRLNAQIIEAPDGTAEAMVNDYGHDGAVVITQHGNAVDGYGLQIGIDDLGSVRLTAIWT